jgi:hypothetical protein
MYAAASAAAGASDLRVPEAWGFDCLYGVGTPLAAPAPFTVADPGHPAARDLDSWQKQNAKSIEKLWKDWTRSGLGAVFKAFWGGGGTKTRTANLDLFDQLDDMPIGIWVRPRFFRMDNDGNLQKVTPEPHMVAAHDHVPQTVLGECITASWWLS